MDKINNIIERIKAMAKQQGITQTFLCKQIGKRATYLNEVKLGKDRIHDNEIEVIASILNTTPAYLRGETDDPAQEVKNKETPITPTVQELIDEVYGMTDNEAAAILSLIREIKGRRA